MSKLYSKPVVLLNEDLAEGVFTASLGGGGGGGSDRVESVSGVGCHSASAYIHQKPETGRGDFRVQVNGDHLSTSEHSSESQIITIKFNQNVTFKECGFAALESGSGTNTLKLRRSIHQNPRAGGIGGGDVVVTSDDGLGLISIRVDCENPY